MFSFFYSSNMYRLIKSGFLFDFLVKKSVYFFLLKLYLLTNVFFSEKFIIENIFFKNQKFSLFFFKMFGNLTNIFSFKIISIIGLVIIIILIL